MNKTLGKVTPLREEPRTLVVEIESMLNTRRLLYVESEESSERAPIDFLQNEFEDHRAVLAAGQSQYLTSLREEHKKEVGHRRRSRMAPKIGQVVLICDALQPRYMWKIGRTKISKLWRPVNILLPLELEDANTDVDTEFTSQQHPEMSESEPDLAEAEDVVRDEQQEDVESGNPGPEVRGQQNDVEEMDPGPEVRV
ncbi:unnamed protein product [Heligmosomoides polygyrus]|uniref:DUF5641 domain-containing protein n=1 Tax=Heligmosomoides polygyrus TaxID=6339 RepID=A0A183GJ28_HELPZ|nr:unnamed protein product [Heligmosomoides polygyrus]